MRWRGNRQSNNIEDRRGSSSTTSGEGLIRLLPLVFRFLGFKGTAIVALGFVGYTFLLGGNLNTILGLAPESNVSTKQVKQSPAEKQMVEFVSVVLADTEETWNTLFKQFGKKYKEPGLVLFRKSTRSSCGLGKAAMGPFYCPADQKIYIDLSFFNDLKQRHNAPGDFAQAYVIAHEVGHHVQTLLGISKQVHQAKKGKTKSIANSLSVKQELQADCFAGIWAHHAARVRNLLEAGDVDEGLTAASAIGDDRLQKQAQGYVVPESFTHGSSAQRVRWFKVGLNSGSIKGCDTFKTASL